ncbi:MAG: CinA family protein [Halorientalis sp.]
MDAGDDPAAAARLGDRLADRGETLATAESCTGGLVASLVTDVPGASDYFERGYVTYTYDAKQAVLDVDGETLADVGAVSERVARQMAAGARAAAGTTWAVSTTGVSGPDPDPTGEPVGTVLVGVAGPGAGGPTTAEQYHFEGSRTGVKRRAARQALSELLSAVESEE